jgi:hypothetical protein
MDLYPSIIDRNGGGPSLNPVFAHHDPEGLRRVEERTRSRGRGARVVVGVLSTG